MVGRDRMGEAIDRLGRRRDIVDRCPGCGHSVMVDDDFAGADGRIYHARCLPERVEERAYRRLYDERTRGVRLRR